YGTTVANLAALNHLTDPNLIYVGQLLSVGAARAAASRTWGAPAGATYHVAAGDTLGSIAARYGTTVANLAALNHLTDPSLILVGQVLNLGSARTVSALAAASTPAP